MRFHLFSKPPNDECKLPWMMRPNSLTDPDRWCDQAEEQVADGASKKVVCLQDYFISHPAHDRGAITIGDQANPRHTEAWVDWCRYTVAELPDIRRIIIDDPGNKGSRPTDIRWKCRQERDGAIARIMWDAMGHRIVDEGIVVSGFGMYGLWDALDWYRCGPVLYNSSAEAMDSLGYAQERHQIPPIPWVPHVGYFRPGLGQVSTQDLTARLVECRDAGCTEVVVWFPRDISATQWVFTEQILNKFVVEDA
jgi:hypothetical protein